MPEPAETIARILADAESAETVALNPTGYAWSNQARAGWPRDAHRAAAGARLAKEIWRLYEFSGSGQVPGVLIRHVLEAYMADVAPDVAREGGSENG